MGKSAISMATPHRDITSYQRLITIMGANINVSHMLISVMCFLDIFHSS